MDLRFFEGRRNEDSRYEGFCIYVPGSATFDMKEFLYTLLLCIMKKIVSNKFECFAAQSTEIVGGKLAAGPAPF